MEQNGRLVTGRPEAAPTLLESLKAEMAYQAEHPPGDDVHIGSFFEALLEEPEDSPLAVLIRDSAELRMQRSGGNAATSEIAGSIRAGIFSYSMYADQDFTYDGLDTPEAWREQLDRINDDLAAQPFKSETLLLNSFLYLKNVQTNIPSRYVAIELLMQSLRERFGEEIEWLDVGSGIMQGAHQLLRKDTYPMRLHRARDPHVPNGHREALAGRLNEVLDRPSLIKDCVCIDLAPVYHNGEREGYEAGIIEYSIGSLRPAEVLDDAFMERFNGLSQQKAPNVDFIQTDFTNREYFEELREQLGGKRFHVISFMTMWHQLSEAKQQAAFEHATQLLKPGGVIAVQDFAYLRSHARPMPPESLSLYQRWHATPDRYRTFLYDSAHPEPGLQEAFRFKDSRCRELTLGAARLAVQNGLVPLKKLLLEPQAA